MEKKENTQNDILKLNFFEKIWYAISKFERYPELAALGVSKAIGYFTKIILIISVIYTLIYTYYANNIAEFEEENLTTSQKIIYLLAQNSENTNEDIKQALISLSNYSIASIITTLFISIFITFYISTITDVLLLSLFGIVTCLLTKIKINYKALFNMSIYALTLSTILRLIYLALITLFDFTIKYFDAMYIAVAYISLAAAIFIIKSNLLKHQMHLVGVINQNSEKIQEKIEELTRKKTEEKEEKNDEENNDSEENKEKERDAGEGMNA